MRLIQVPEVLREKLGPEGAQAIVELFNQAGRETRYEVVLLAEERFGRRLAEGLAGLEMRLDRRLGEELGKVWAAVAELEVRLTREMASLEARLLRRTFAFWVGQSFVLLSVLLSVLFAFFKP